MVISIKSRIVMFLFLSAAIVAVKGQQDLESPLRRQVLYAPFREQYDIATKKSLKKGEASKTKKKGCVFCKDIQANDDAARLLMTRFEHNVVFLNLFPYARGQILIIPNAHVKDLKDLNQAARDELMAIITAVSSIFREVLGAPGANIGINIGSIAGASKPDHLHIHALPRFGNDHKAFIQILGETHVIQWDLKKLYWKLKPAFDELKDQICPSLISDIQEYYELGQHDKEVTQVMERAWLTLKTVPVAPMSAIVIDVDETVLSNYEYFKANGWEKDSEEGMAAWKALQKRSAITPVFEFYNKAVARGFKIIFISSSGDDLREAIVNNLISEGYRTFEQLILRMPEEQKQGFSSKGFSSFKTNRRQQLVDEGYDIVACIGDQWSDLQGGNTGLKIKVPTCFE